MSLLVAKAKEQVAGCVLNAAKSAMEKGILEKYQFALISETEERAPQA